MALVLLLGLGCDRAPSPSSTATSRATQASQRNNLRALQVEYEARANVSGVEVDARLMSSSAMEDDIKVAIEELKRQKVEVVIAMRKLMRDQIQRVQEAKLVGDDADILANIEQHIAQVEEFASERIILKIKPAQGDDGNPEAWDDVVLGTNAYKAWARGLLGYGIIDFAPKWEALDEWPSEVHRERRPGASERLVLADGTRIVPGLRFLMWKRVPGMIGDLSLSIMIFQDRKLHDLVLEDLRDATGQDFGSDIDAWRQWWEQNRNKEFQIEHSRRP